VPFVHKNHPFPQAMMEPKWNQNGTKSIIFSLTQTPLFDKRARPDYKAGARPGKRRGVLTLLI
jgi:hypothetical protein